MSKPIFILDMDGCLARQQKIWHESPAYVYDGNIEGRTEKVEVPGILGVYKQISDHDSWAIDTLRDKVHIVIFSGDPRINMAWAQRRKVDFVYTSSPDNFHQDKWNQLLAYLNENGLDGQPFYYLGDAMPDFNCMMNAAIAFTPADCCLNLMRRLKRDGACVYQLQSNGGEGCFEEAINYLIQKGDLPEEIVE